MVVLLLGCSPARTRLGPSYEETVREAKRALEKDRLFEARRWAVRALEMKPEGSEPQRLMAKVLDREIARERTLSPKKWPEELVPEEKSLLIKTWLERAQSFLELNELDEALRATEEIFQIDPENRKASRLIDQIQEKARREGTAEELFLQGLYQEEVEARIERYLLEARTGLENDRRGPARLALEKVLLLDPKNRDGQRLLAQLEEKEKTIPTPPIRQIPSGK